MSRQPCEAEVAREARRVFRKLLAPGARVVESAGGFGVFVSARARRPAFVLDGGLMRAFLARDWLRPRGTSPESWRLSEAGEGWYLREQAAHEPFAAQHQARAEKLIETATGSRRVTVNEGESPLGWLRRRRRIDAAQFDAGERLRRDYTLAQLTPRMGVDFTAPIVLGRQGMKTQTTLSDTVIAAKQRFRAAMEAVGPGLSDILFDVCCHLSGLEEIERHKNWPRRSAKVVLDIALDRLALHYGLTMTARGRGRLRAWQAEAAE